MSEKPVYEEIKADIDAMGDALAALNRIPTSKRRRLAFNWLVERVEADIQGLARDEHIERVADVVGVLLGDPV